MVCLGLGLRRRHPSLAIAVRLANDLSKTLPKGFESNNRGELIRIGRPAFCPERLDARHLGTRCFFPTQVAAQLPFKGFYANRVLTMNGPHHGWPRE